MERRKSIIESDMEGVVSELSRRLREYGLPMIEGRFDNLAEVIALHARIYRAEQ